MNVEYEIVNIDYFEQDATLVIDGLRLYFQFSYRHDQHREPTLRDALQFLVRDGRYHTAKDEEWLVRVSGFTPQES